MQDQPFLPPQNAPPYNSYNNDIYQPPQAYQIGAAGGNGGEAEKYYAQPYGQGGLGYAANDKASVYSSNSPTPHQHSQSGSQVHLVPYPPWGAAGQR
jgi:hypothetical protein